MISTILGLIGFDPWATFGGWALSGLGAMALGPAGILLWLLRNKWALIGAAVLAAAVAVAFVVLGLRLNVAKLERDVAREQAQRAQQAAEVGIANQRLAAAGADLAQCRRANAAALQAVEAVKDWSGRSLAALEADRARIAAEKQRTRTVIREVDRAPNDCAVPLPYRALFDELRRQRQDREGGRGAAAGGDRDPGRAPPAAAGPVDLRPRAGTASGGDNRQ
jgi:hypothetical protein